MIIIKAEGVAIADRPAEGRGRRAAARARARRRPAGIETRVTVLGHVVRGGRAVGVRSPARQPARQRRGARAARRGQPQDGRVDAAGRAPRGRSATRSPADPYCWLVDLRRRARRDREFAARDEPARALARRRVRRDRGRLLL